MGKIKLQKIEKPIPHEVLISAAFASAVIPFTPDQKDEAELSRQVRMNDGE